MRIGTALCTLAVLAAACGTDDGGDTAADPSETAEETAEETTDVAAGDQTVCYVTAAEAHPYVTPANDALDVAADGAGTEIIRLSQEFDAQTGTDQLNTCIAREVDGIILWPLDPAAYVSGLAAADAAGIPTVLINSPMDEEGLALADSFTGPDTYEQGIISANQMNELLGGEGKVVIIAGQAGNGTTIGRTDGFTEELERLGSNIEVLATVNADFDQQKALVASRDLITRFGDDIDGVYANDDTMARGFIDAYKETGGDSIPLIIGINGQTDAFQSIRDGEMASTILQSPDADGKLAMDTMLAILAGETVDARIPLELFVIDSSNVDDFEPAL
jgi:ABC-type sugar transport system substrate-binding protein